MSKKMKILKSNLPPKVNGGVRAEKILKVYPHRLCVSDKEKLFEGNRKACVNFITRNWLQYQSIELMDTHGSFTHWGEHEDPKYPD